VVAILKTLLIKETCLLLKLAINGWFHDIPRVKKRNIRHQDYEPKTIALDSMDISTFAGGHLKIQDGRQLLAISHSTTMLTLSSNMGRETKCMQ